MENCKWLLYVSTCLIKSAEAADLLHKDVSVVLQGAFLQKVHNFHALIFQIFNYLLFLYVETDGRDMCCVISSLTVLLLDPYFRTLNGFQSLIQKEWVIMGHPFCTRLRHIYTNEEENQQVFKIFSLLKFYCNLKSFENNIERSYKAIFLIYLLGLS